ncbi:FAST kinase domain-containing protein 5, mitochondrial [Spodoptera litura]|uniref:FAST kinase domain-containing protein 5, mitochondrial n=1 Tax=Spodoptera litura TaxID=69820 RepID=A0A9J7J067_SPOLT|nr:FAST kinase domain-containing protein 5, mitochondrial [Spodoptera litura]
MSFLVRIVRNFTVPKYRSNIGALNSLQKYSRRRIHCSSHLCGRMFLEHENNYAYSILEKKGYAVSLKSDISRNCISEQEFQEALKCNWSKKSQAELFDYFLKFALYCSEHKLCISNQIFDTYIDSLTDSIKLGTDEELKTLFYTLNKWPDTPSIRTRNIIEVWAALDDECLNRLKNWSYDELLTFLSLFYMINVIRYSDYCVKALQKLASKAKNLTPAQLVHTLFFIGIWRKSPFDMHNLEVEINKKYSQFTIDELAIISMGYFKSKTPIRDPELVKKIIATVIENSKTIHEVSLAALLKLIRYSTKSVLDDRINSLLEALQSEVPRLSVMCNVHMALVGTSTLSLHKQCLDNIAAKVIKTMSQTRVKDLERLVLTYGTFGLRPNTEECFFTKVMDELRKPERIIEISIHGRSFACCIAYLTLLGIYPVDLISRVLTPEFRERTYGKYCFNYGREILTLNNVAEIFCSDANINFLENKEKKILAKKYTDYVPREDYVKQYNITEQMFLDILKVLKEARGGDDYVIGDHILPHYQRGDIIICNDHSGAPVAVKGVFPPSDFGLMRKLPDDKTWIVLVIAGRNAIIHGTDNATGFFTSKVRELEALGYHGVLVPWSQFSKLRSTADKAVFLNNLIDNAVNKNK